MFATKTHLKLLKEGAEKLGVHLTEKALSQFSLYLEELLLWSPKIDLVAQTDPVLLIRKHVLDSIAVASYLARAVNILDLGSGAGLPGVPLALVLPEISFTLIEARRKRVSFLKQVARKIGMQNLLIREGRAEVLAQDIALQDAFAIVITRATWSVVDLLELAYPFLRAEGKVFAMKGPRYEEERHLREFSREKYCLLNKHDYTLPFGTEQRTLLIFEKHVSRDT